LEALVRCHDEPFSDAANIPLYLLCQELQGAVKVVLQGDGGDEVFGGYNRYSLLQHAARWRFLAALPSLATRHFPDRLRRILEAFADSDPGMRMALLMTVEPQSPSPLRVLNRELRKRVWNEQAYGTYKSMNERFGHLEPVQRMLYTDTQIILPDIFLEKVDKSTMAHGIEARVPFLDNELTAFAMSLPAELKVKRGTLKHLLKRALRYEVPREVLHGRKRGFGVPYVDWLRGPLYDFARANVLAKENSHLFDTELLTQLFEELKSTGRCGFLLWKCLQLSIWMRLYRVQV